MAGVLNLRDVLQRLFNPTALTLAATRWWQRQRKAV